MLARNAAGFFGFVVKFLSVGVVVVSAVAGDRSDVWVAEGGLEGGVGLCVGGW